MDVETQRHWGYWHRVCRAAISHDWLPGCVVKGLSAHMRTEQQGRPGVSTRTQTRGAR